MKFNSILIACALMLSLPSLAQEGPLSLTASDGTGLSLVEYEAQAVRQGPFSFTQLRLVFENPQARVLEGRFEITLPDGARISRFAMKLGERFQEGEVVEKQKARRVYEDFLHRKQDPALLESAAGNAFRARVFPIPARGRKELIVSYSHSNNDEYRLRLQGLSQVERLSVSVNGKEKLKQKKVVPGQDFVLKNDASLKALRTSYGVVIPVVPVPKGQNDAFADALILVDTSASQALGYDAKLQKLSRLLKTLATRHGDPRVVIAAFDNDARRVFEGRASESKKIVRILRQRRPLGATHFGKALAWASEALAKQTNLKRLIIISDGVTTVGEESSSALEPVKKRLEASGVQRVDVIVSGGIRDLAYLQSVVDLGVKHAGAVVDGDKSIVSIANALERKTLREAEVQVQGSDWFWPKVLKNVQAGEVRWVFAKKIPKRIRVGKSVVKVESIQGNRLLVGRELAGAQLEMMVAKERAAVKKAEKKKLQEAIVALSKEARVLSPFTALLVLEKESDYDDYKIDRKALGEILTVKGARLVEEKRAAVKFAKKPKPKPVKRRPKAKSDKKMKKSVRSREGEGESSAKASIDFGDENVEGELEKPAAEYRSAPGDDSDSDDSEDEAKVMEEIAAPAEVVSGRGGMGSRGAGSGGGGDGIGRLGGPGGPAPAKKAPRKISPLDAYEGKFREVQAAILSKQFKKALSLAKGWREEAPGDVLALVALGDAYRAQGDKSAAARAYSSIIDLFSSRADLRRYAGNLLESLNDYRARLLASDSYEKAAEQRADHPASHRMLAYSLVKLGRYAEAMDAIEKGMKQRTPSDRFRGVPQILREDAGLIAKAWVQKAPKLRIGIEERLKKLNVQMPKSSSLRFILTWETDANDVDFHIYDKENNHAFYSQPHLTSGGDLYADVTTGYGPECFAIKGDQKRSGPYRLQAHYYSRGPMGYGMGTLEVVHAEKNGSLRFENRPFVVMKDGAYLELGDVQK